MKTNNQKILPNLWFDGVAEDAAKFYTTVFQNSHLGNVSRYGKEGTEIHGNEEGTVMNVEFTLEGQQILGLNGGPHFKFNPSVSFFVMCESKEEIGLLWEKLLEKGEALMPLDKYEWSESYGWLQDRFGLNWQLMLGDVNDVGQKITPLLFFTGDQRGRAEEAINFYTKVFNDSAVDGVLKYDEENEFTSGTVKHAQFKIEKMKFMAMDSGIEHKHPFNEAISFIIDCKDQEEIDYYWNKLSDGGDPKAMQCGWLKDKFGVSWQVVPVKILTGMLSDPRKEKTERVTAAFMKMKKLEIEELEKAYGEPVNNLSEI